MASRKKTARPAPEPAEVDKPLRADALRNRARILEAAEAVIAEKGAGASTEDIAQRAGVGIGTVFRHFPTKEALLEAILVELLRGLAADANARATTEEPAQALFGFFTRAVEQSARKRMLSGALAAAGRDVRSVTSAAGQDVARAIDLLLTRAQKAGAVRRDVHSKEVIALLVAATHAAEHAGEDHALRARTLAILFDGLRPQK
jgi:AcrR family transcriptional regulator